MNPNPWIVSNVTVARKSKPEVKGDSATIWFDGDNKIAHVQVKKIDHYVEIPGDDVADVTHV